MNITKQKERKETTITGISVSELTDTFRRLPVNFDETHLGVEIFVDILVVEGGGCLAVKKVCGRHLKYSYNVCKIS